MLPTGKERLGMERNEQAGGAAHAEITTEQLGKPDAAFL
jgi:hypothetical protein